MEELKNLIELYPTESIMVLLGIYLFLFLLFIINAIRFSKFKKKYYKLVGDNDNENLENILKDSNEKLRNIKMETSELNGEIEKIQRKLSLSVQNVGVVRYDAFDNIGPRLSYSLALLDEYLNGVVITSIHGRDQSTSYAKPIVKGKSEYSLSVEELQAIEKAVKGEFYSNTL